VMLGGKAFSSEYRDQSFITSIYPLTGASQVCGDSHNVIRNISVELQMS